MNIPRFITLTLTFNPEKEQSRNIRVNINHIVDYQDPLPYTKEQYPYAPAYLSSTKAKLTYLVGNNPEVIAVIQSTDEIDAMLRNIE